MKNYGNSQAYANARRMTGGSAQIPPGAYVCEIKAAKEASYDWGSRLELAIDITEGEYKGFFKQQFDENTSEDKKWKGTLRITLPKDDGSEADGRLMSRLKSTITDIEESNEGFVYKWDEKTLVGKAVGIVFRTKHTAIDGKVVAYSEACWTTTVEAVRSGKVKIPNDYYDNKYKEANANASSDGFMAIPDGAGAEVPFDF